MAFSGGGFKLVSGRLPAQSGRRWGLGVAASCLPRAGSGSAVDEESLAQAVIGGGPRTVSGGVAVTGASQRPLSGRRRPRALARALRGLAAALLLAAAGTLVLPGQVSAQERTLVDNTSISDETVSKSAQLSQRFNTGANSGGYTLTKVLVGYHDSEGDKFSVKVCTTTGADQPTSTCTNFTAPTGSFSPGRIEFTPSAGMTLAASTKMER